MQTKQIILRGKNMIVGYGNGRPYYGRGTFIATKEASHIDADFVSGGSWDSTNKEIAADWVNAKISTDTLKPLPDYFGEDLFEIVTPLQKSVSRGQNPDGSYAYDKYYDQPAFGSSGDNLHRSCLAVYFLIKHGVSCFNSAGQLVQPVTFDLAHTGAKQVTVTPVDGIAPFQFSKDGVTWSTNPVLDFDTTDNNHIFVKDNAGTVTTTSI